MANISKITLPNGSTYDIKDATARDAIAALESYTDYLGVTTTSLTDGATTNPIKIDNKDVTAKKGNIANYGSKEFIFNGTAWQEFGDMSGLGSLAYKDSASGNYTPAGTVSKPTFSGTEGNVSVSGTAAGSVTISKGTGTANYTPQGSISVTPTVTLNKKSIAVINTEQTEEPSLSTTVENETLTITFSPGSIATDDEEVATGVASATATGSFTGTGAELKAAFTGGTVTSTGKFTPAGSVSQPTFSGTQGSVTVS